MTKTANGELTVDANHPLAGETSTFQVTVTSIRDASREAAPDLGGLP